MEPQNNNSITTLLTKAFKRIDEVGSAPNGVIGIPSGYKELDACTLGWQPSNFVIIAGRPAMGKTALALNLARNAAVDYNKSVLYFSMDESSAHLTNRLLSIETSIACEKIRKALLEPIELKDMNSKIEGLLHSPLFIDDTAFLSVEELCKRAREFTYAQNIKLIVIDYLQLLDTSSNNEQAKHICVSLKKLAKELNLPIIALSQLPRSVELRKKDKRPLVKDLRELGIPDQITDMVIFLYRASYYGMEKADNDLPENSAELSISKNRNGSYKLIVLDFIERIGKFVEFEQSTFNLLYKD
ncbi:MAG: DnaB-like helicase C-terminal domain-containing protein [Bacteroidetes bacterium]|nr:DnaB-like helicase C-terminal domain-containing protein [Bacteroidota bacterium]